MSELIHDDYVTGERDVTSTLGTFAASQNIPFRTPIARVITTGELKPWDPSATDGTQNAIGLTVFAVDTTGEAKQSPFHDGGCFNPDLINWPDAVTTPQKSGCFDKTNIVTQTLG